MSWAGAIGKTNQVLNASVRKCPTLVSTSHEAQQIPERLCNVVPGSETRKMRRFMDHQCLCLQVAVPDPSATRSWKFSSHCSSSPLSSSEETTSHWLENNLLIQSQPMRDDEFGCDAWNHSSHFGPDLRAKLTC